MSAPSSDSKAELFRRVHAALNRSHTIKPPAPPAVDESIARLARPGDDLVKLFHARAAASGMFVHRPKPGDVTRHLVEFLGTKNIRSVVLGPVPVAAGLEQEIAAAGIRIIDWRAAEGLDIQFDVDCGITGVRAALAETGSMILGSDANHSRGLSLIPPLHVAIVRPADIIPDMIDYWAGLRGIPGYDLPSNMVFITGPSKTADIEGELVTGVHGPEEVHVLLVDE